MYSLLDQIIDNASGPRVVSEQHDLGAINWVAGLSDPGEMVACGFWQEGRRRDGETDEAYAARLNGMDVPEQVLVLVKAAALKRAGLNVTGGRVAVMTAGAPPWHGLGVNVAEAVNAAQCRRLAGLDWTVSKRPLSYVKADGTTVQSVNAWSIVRDDTQEELGAVGSRYKPLQNADGFDFLDAVIGQFGARYETAGALYNGSKVWMLVHLPRQSFVVNGGDQQDAYALFENVHDGSGCGYVYPTSHRPVCANTVRVASSDRHKGLRIRHTGDVRGKVADAQRALGLAVKEFEVYKGQAEALYHKPLAVEPYANDVLDAVLEVTEAQARMGADALLASMQVTQANWDLERKRVQRQIDKRAAVLDDIIERYESERCGVGDIRGTAWAAFNAVTEHADHNDLTRERSRSAHFESVLTGTADVMKQTALQLALSA